MFAVISHNGKQYKVEKGKSYNFDLIDSEKKAITFAEVLLVSDNDKVSVGTPHIEGAVVTGEITDRIKDDKVLVFKFHAKKHYKRTQGHRQQYSVVKISDIKL